MKYLFDTNTIIYWWKNNQNIEKKALSIGLDNIAVPFTVISELFYGAYNSTNIDNNIKKINDLIHQINIIDSNVIISQTFGKIKSNLKKIGKIVDDADIFIASIALENNLILVTNNTKHFQYIDNLQIENWI